MFFIAIFNITEFMSFKYWYIFYKTDTTQIFFHDKNIDVY